MADVLDFNSAPRQLAVVTPQDWEARLDALRTALRVNAGDLVREIFPRARIQSGEARIGDVSGADGESLAISLHGDRAGLWHDHATGEGGDLIELWLQTQNYGPTEFPKAVDDLERWLGLSSAPRFTSAVTSTAKARKADADRQPPVEHALGAPVASWHYLSADGAVLAIVRRYDLNATDPETGKRKKTFRPFTAAGRPGMPDPRPLYRLPHLNTASEVVLVEGEKAADALAHVGIEATTQMGGGKADPAKTDWSPLAGKTVLIWQDNDDAGAGLAERVRPALEAIGCTVSTIAIPAGKPKAWDAADAVAEGDDVGAILATGRRPVDSQGAPVQRFKIMSIARLVDVAPPEWRIDGIFPTHGSSVLYGAFETYKTFIAIDMTLALATGRPWMGRTTKACSILYIAGEGQVGLGMRVKGWLSAKGVEEGAARFHGLPEAVALPHVGDQDDLLRAIDAMADRPEVIVLDTVTRMTGGGSLNDEKDAQAYVRGMDRLRIATGAHILNIGHAGKDKERGILGSTVLPAAMETIIMVERRNQALTLINSNPKGKQKDGPNFDDIKLRTQVVDFQHRGETLKTVVLMPDDEPVSDDADQVPAGPGRPQGANQIAVMTALRKAKGEPLGLTRLSLMIGKDPSTTMKSVTALAEKGALNVLEEGGAKRWTIR